MLSLAPALHSVVSARRHSAVNSPRRCYQPIVQRLLLVPKCSNDIPRSVRSAETILPGTKRSHRSVITRDIQGAGASFKSEAPLEAQGRRALMTALLSSAVALQAWRPADAAPADAEKENGEPDVLQVIEKIVEKVFSSEAEVNEDGSPKAAADSKGLGQLGLLALLALVLIPLLKIVGGGFIAYQTLQFSKSEKRNRKSGREQLADLLGAGGDDLDKVSFEVRRLNDELASSSAALADKVASKGVGDQLRRAQRQDNLLRGWAAMLQSLPEDKRSKVARAMREYSQKESERWKDLEEARKDWREAVLSKDVAPSARLARVAVEAAAAEQVENEVRLLKALREDLSSNQVKDALKLLGGGYLPGGADHPPSEDTVYVLEFNGDTQASGVAALAREVTAIVGLSPLPGEVVVKVTSPGGTVTGYGLCGAELTRITDAGIKLTVCVDQLAASGGYLMACVADQILAAPYAAVGSIGVVAQQPNVAERLQREGVDFITTTAGKWKRTVTPFTKPSEDDLAKQQEDVKLIYNIFAGYVKRNRPHLDIDAVATGEVWYGPDALARGLVDRLQTSSDYLLHRMKGGAQLFSLKYKPPSTSPLAGLVSAALSDPSIVRSLAGFLQQPGGKGLGAQGLQALNALGTMGEAEKMHFLSTSVIPMLQALPPDVRMELARDLVNLE